jgi:hypothetical protein
MDRRRRREALGCAVAVGQPRGPCAAAGEGAQCSPSSPSPGASFWGWDDGGKARRRRGICGGAVGEGTGMGTAWRWDSRAVGPTRAVGEGRVGMTGGGGGEWMTSFADVDH